eukprot:7196307-Prymnesium_polylepis.1
MHKLANLDAIELEKHVGVIVRRLDDESDDVRKAAEDMLKEIEPTFVNRAKLAAMEPTAIVARLHDGCQGVRRAALLALDKLELMELTAHADIIVLRLQDRNFRARRLTISLLGKLEPSVLGKYTSELVQRLEESGPMRIAVEDVLARLEPPIVEKARLLAMKPAMIIARLEDVSAGVRRASLLAMVDLTISILLQHADVVRKQLDDEDHHVQCAARLVLHKLYPSCLLYTSDAADDM